jgi:DNA-binding transcriptional regulator GbsR (MarR family)
MTRPMRVLAEGVPTSGFRSPPKSQAPKSQALDKRTQLPDNSVMTEISGYLRKLPPAVEQIVLRWGDLGGQWGVNRSVAQIQALLFLSDTALTAEDIAEKLGMARSNVSNSLRELLNWKLVRRVPVLGDRRDHYEAETDLWQMATKVAQGRKEREIDPMVAAIRDAMARLDENSSDVSPQVKSRLHQMHEFVTTVDSWYQQMLHVPPETLMRLIRMGSKVVGLLNLVAHKRGGGSESG